VLLANRNLLFLAPSLTLVATMTQPRVPRVAVLVDTATGWGRRLVHGILMYAQKHGGWHVWVEARGQDEKLRLPPGWRGDGIIARVSSPALAEHLSGRRAVVNISSIKPRGARFHSVASDTKACAQVAADHLLDRGLRNFGYCSLVERGYVDFHRRAFAEVLGSRGYPCAVYSPGRGCGKRAPWEAQLESLIDWLRGLPKPVGILTWATKSGVELINACGDAGIRVPDEIAVLGGDEDDLLCEACRPPLSSVHVAAEQIGHDAAQMLDELMQGRKPAVQDIQIAPTGIVARQSTDLLAVEDTDLVAAIRFIRDHCDETIQVVDVARAASVSRRSLERRFLSFLGRTIHDEIARAHLERAIDLLVRTEMPIPAIASAAGYGSSEYFATVFKKSMGTTPLKYRARIRGR
jgi:LacI family transcriptional regulator